MNVLRVAGAGLVLAVVVIACSSEDKVDNATCNSAGRPGCYTEADCQSYGRAANCAISGLGSGLASCITQCSFAGCDHAPTCGAPSGVADAGKPFDYDSDPECKAALTDSVGHGLFAAKPAASKCASSSEVTVNGAKRYPCKCQAACPCGFECGSISLAVGGALGSVCAPKE